MSHYDEFAVVESPLERVRSLIVREADVKAVHRLVALAGGRFGFLIETPFMTFPRFVVGTTDADNAAVEIRAKTSALWGAERCFEECFGAMLREGSKV